MNRHIIEGFVLLYSAGKPTSSNMGFVTHSNGVFVCLVIRYGSNEIFIFKTQMTAKNDRQHEFRNVFIWLTLGIFYAREREKAKDTSI